MKEIQVIRVIDENRVALNIGTRDGVERGHIFVVYALDDKELNDPVTHEPLGRLEILRGRGRVVHVQDKLCTVECIEKGPMRRIVRKPSPLLPNVVSIFGSPETEELQDDTLPFEGVRVGDKAKRVQ